MNHDKIKNIVLYIIVIFLITTMFFLIIYDLIEFPLTKSNDKFNNFTYLEK